jgi:hypothetical protein
MRYRTTDEFSQRVDSIVDQAFNKLYLANLITSSVLKFKLYNDVKEGDPKVYVLINKLNATEVKLLIDRIEAIR